MLAGAPDPLRKFAQTAYDQRALVLVLSLW